MSISNHLQQASVILNSIEATKETDIVTTPNSYSNTEAINLSETSTGSPNNPSFQSVIHKHSESPIEPVPVYLRDRHELSSEKLAEIRAKDAERKRRWREKRRAEKRQSSSEEAILKSPSASTVMSSNEYCSRRSPSRDETREQNHTNCALNQKRPDGMIRKRRERKTSVRRADISPDRLKVMRAKDAERKRRARMRKRLMSQTFGENEKMVEHRVRSLSMGAQPLPKLAAARLSSTSNDHSRELHIDVEDDYEEDDYEEVAPCPLTVDSGVDCLFSPLSLTTPLSSPLSEMTTSKARTSVVSSSSTSNSSIIPETNLASTNSGMEALDAESPEYVPAYRIPRKMLPVDQLKTLRARDNARKKEQRAKRRQDHQIDMASALLRMISTTTATTTSPTQDVSTTISEIAAASFMKLSSVQLLSPIFGSTTSQPSGSMLNRTLLPCPLSLGSMLPSTLSSGLPGSTLLCSPSLPLNASLSIDVSHHGSISAPASLLGLTPPSESAAFELIKNLLEKTTMQSPSGAPVSASPIASNVQLSTPINEEKAAAKRAARAARIARMTQQQKDALRASDRERKRLWRMRRRLASETSVASSRASISPLDIAELSPDIASRELLPVIVNPKLEEQCHQFANS